MHIVSIQCEYREVRFDLCRTSMVVGLGIESLGLPQWGRSGLELARINLE